MKTKLLLLIVLTAVTASGVPRLFSAEKSARQGGTAPLPRIHPKVFSLIGSWISDSVSPVVTELNLDAIQTNDNQFSQADLEQDGDWTKCPGAESRGFMRYRVLAAKKNRYQVEYQENGGGSLTTVARIEFSIEKRAIRRNGKPAIIRVLRVLSYSDGPTAIPTSDIRRPRKSSNAAQVGVSSSGRL